MSDLPTGTVTFLLTDVEGSTRLWELHAESMRAALARHDQLVEEHVVGHGGVLLKSRGEGDSCFAVFARATDALSAALSLQLTLNSEPWPTPSPLRVRMALHTGEADLRDGDYHGPAVNRCARLRAIAHGGQVLLSHSTYDLVRDSLPDRASLRDLGEQRLRDLIRPEPVLQLCHPDLPSDFPALRTLDAYPNNLPLQLTSFVGREREMAEIRRLLGTTRLLTLTGTGGCGKTRLAYQVAADLLDEYPDGVRVSELAALSDPSLVPQTVASDLGVREQPGQPILQTLQTHLKPKHLLIVLDNCEHLLDASARLADALLRACPKLQMLATSRESLGISGETSYRVPSLSLPDPRELPPLASLTQYEAVRLFVDRAVAALSSFAVTDQSAPAVAQVCWRLDGIPLAIELAAARVRGLGVEQLASRLDDRFRLLTGGSRTALRRQQTLRATIDWSYDLLTEPERVLLRRLSVFAGGWTLEAAESVCQGESASGTIEPTDVLDLLLRLVDRSLVVADEVTGEDRYHLPETIRQYAQERLFESGEVAAVRDRHLEWYLALAERGKAALLSDQQQRAWLERLEPEHDNLLAALDWILARQEDAGMAIRLAAALGQFWEVTGRAIEMDARLGPVLARPGGDLRTRVEVLSYAALAKQYVGPHSQGRSLLEDALVLAREIGYQLLTAFILARLAWVAFDEGEFATSSALWADVLGVARLVGDRDVVARGLTFHAMALCQQGEDSAARQAAEEALAIYRELSDRGGAGGALLMLGRLAMEEGDLSRARALIEEGQAQESESVSGPATCIRLGHLGDLARAEGQLVRAAQHYHDALAAFREWTARGDWLRATFVLTRLAGLWAVSGRERKAALLYGAMHGYLQAVGLNGPWFAPRDYERDEAAAREALGEGGWARASAEGRAMSIPEAVEYALRETS